MKCLQGSHFWKELWEAWAVFSRTRSLYSSLSSPPQRTSPLPPTMVVTKEASFARERAVTVKAGALGGSSVSVSHPPRTVMQGAEKPFLRPAQLDPGLHPSFVTYRTEISDEGLLLLKVESDRPAVKWKSIKSNPSIFEPLIGPVQNSQLGM